MTPTATVKTSLVAAALAIFLCAAPAVAQKESVSDFVRGSYYHGLPREQAAAYGPEDLPELLALLEDPAEKGAWANAIDLVGIIGDESAAPALVDFFENRFEGEVDAPTFRALTLAPLSLGRLVQSTDGEAVQFLERGVRTGAWAAGRANWTFPTLQDSERASFFTKLSVRGLAVAGRPHTLETLQLLRGETATRGAIFQRIVAPEIDEAIIVNELLIERGRGFLDEEEFEREVRRRLIERRPE